MDQLHWAIFTSFFLCLMILTASGTFYLEANLPSIGIGIGHHHHPYHEKSSTSPDIRIDVAHQGAKLIQQNTNTADRTVHYPPGVKSIDNLITQAYKNRNFQTVFYKDLLPDYTPTEVYDLPSSKENNNQIGQSKYDTGSDDNAFSGSKYQNNEINENNKNCTVDPMYYPHYPPGIHGNAIIQQKQNGDFDMIYQDQYRPGFKIQDSIIQAINNRCYNPTINGKYPPELSSDVENKEIMHPRQNMQFSDINARNNPTVSGYNDFITPYRGEISNLASNPYFQHWNQKKNKISVGNVPYPYFSNLLSKYDPVYSTEVESPSETEVLFGY